MFRVWNLSRQAALTAGLTALVAAGSAAAADPAPADKDDAKDHPAQADPRDRDGRRGPPDFNRDGPPAPPPGRNGPPRRDRAEV